MKATARFLKRHAGISPKSQRSQLRAHLIKRARPLDNRQKRTTRKRQQVNSNLAITPHPHGIACQIEGARSILHSPALATALRSCCRDVSCASASSPHSPPHPQPRPSSPRQKPPPDIAALHAPLLDHPDTRGNGYSLTPASQSTRWRSSTSPPRPRAPTASRLPARTQTVFCTASVIASRKEHPCIKKGIGHFRHGYKSLCKLATPTPPGAPTASSPLPQARSAP